MTPLDEAIAALSEAPDKEANRLAVFELFSSSELFLLLNAEPTGETVEPRLFDTSEGRFVLTFDREERLTTFADGPAPYAALSGRNIVTMLQGQDIGLGLNLGVAPSSHLFPAADVDWLAHLLLNEPTEQSELPEEFNPPSQIPENLLTALDARLAQAGGLAELAYLASVTYRNGKRGHLLAVIDTVPGAEDTLARSIQEALVFSGLEMGELDVTFMRATEPAAAKLAKVGLRFDLPQIKPAHAPEPPGTDPTKPPRLK